MQRSMSRTALAALMLAVSVTAASAQTDDQNHEAHHPNGAPTTEATPAPQASPGEGQQRGHGMMGPGMGMNPEMMQMMQHMMGQQQGRMGPGMMGQRGPRMGMMGRGGMMRAMFAIMDADGDGTLSREEFQEAHDRIFNHMDADGDGQVTFEEMQAFMLGAPPPARQMPMQEDMPMQEGMDMQHGMNMEGAAATQAYMEAMQAMHEEMAVMQMTGDPGRDFSLMMIPHHQSAIDMAEAYLEHGDDPELTELAHAIIAEQQREIEFLQTWLADNP